MNTTNLRTGATHNFTGYFEETKQAELAIKDASGDDVSLAGATITMKVRPQGSRTATTYTLSGDVLKSVNGNKLLVDFTTLSNRVFDYEIKVQVAQDVFFIDGEINITDRV